MAGMGFMIAASSRKRDDRGRYADGNYSRMDGNEMNYSRMGDDIEMRRRDSRGRYMEDDDDRRMGNDHSTHMDGKYGTEMRRRRDSRGRYMEDEGGSRMAYEGNQDAYRPWPEPHMPPYLDRPESRMRDRNVVHIRDYQDKRRIGFGENRMHHGEGKGGQKMDMGGAYGMSGGHEKLTREKAEKWVRSMHGDDPKTRGEMWSYEDAKKLAEERGLPTEGQEMIDFYVVLNMVYTDYCKVAKEHGVDTEDYYADLAEAWLYDRDAKPPTEKLMAYHKYVIPHGEE